MLARSERSQTSLSTSSRLMRLSLLLANSAGAISLTAAPTLAQSTSTLPPPPTLRGLEATPQPENSLPFVPIDKTFQAPTTTLPAVGSTGYRVLVNGDSALLLQQVQRIEPNAFIAQYKGRRVIQAGVFSNETNARQQVERLRFQGIEANVAGVGASPTQSAGGYVIVIPGGRADLASIRAQVIQLGASEQNVTEKESPYGPHVELGPFRDRKTAEDWNRLLRRSGDLDARVYYAR